jgi:uncharacterized protein
MLQGIAMKLVLSPSQLRVIGCLVEKSLTTPDQYPLSLNALTNACNQKSNREPVIQMSEHEVQNALDSLAEKKLIMNQSGQSSRVQKYKHRFCNTEFGELHLSPQELAIVCVLFLRGPQTPGELRSRTNRLCEFDNVRETESVLSNMVKQGFVVQLDRVPGKRESRYAHCFGSDLEKTTIESASQNAETTSVEPASQNQRILLLEEQQELMQLEIDELRQMIELLLEK